MNALSPTPLVPDVLTWSAVSLSANGWRGRMIQCFAKAEHEVSEALIALSQVARRGADVKFRHLSGQRYEDLAAMIGPQGGFAAEGKKAFAALEAFREHEGVRALLCHGDATLSIDRNNEWVLVVDALAFQKQKPEHSVAVFEQREAEQLLATLRTRGQALKDLLQGLRNKLSGA